MIRCWLLLLVDGDDAQNTGQHKGCASSLASTATNSRESNLLPDVVGALSSPLLCPLSRTSVPVTNIPRDERNVRGDRYVGGVYRVCQRGS